MSDHKMVICEIKLYNYVNKPQKNILWKLNESVLENENVNEGIIKLCKKIPDCDFYFNIKHKIMLLKCNKFPEKVTYEINWLKYPQIFK